MQMQVGQARDKLEFLWLEVTGRCNLRCIHCYADSGPKRPLSDGMEFTDWLRALDEAMSIGCRKVQFIGGEPTLYPDLPQLIEHARHIGFEHVCVYTNGTHFTETLRAAFIAHRVSLAFSVYGSFGAMHDQITLRNGSFERTVYAIRWAVDAGLAVQAGIVEMGINVDDVPHIEWMLREAGVQAVNIDRLRGLGRGSRGLATNSQLRELCGHCGRGKVCISSNGDIYPCVFARFARLGHFHEDSLSEILGGDRLRNFRKDLAEARGVARPRGVHAAGQVSPHPSDVSRLSEAPLHESEVTLSPTLPTRYLLESGLVLADKPRCNPDRPRPFCGPVCNPQRDDSVPFPDCNPEIAQPFCGPSFDTPSCSPGDPPPKERGLGSLTSTNASMSPTSTQSLHQECGCKNKNVYQ